MATSDTKQNNPQDDQNFQNPDKGSKGQQKASSPASRPITGSAGPDYGSDLGTDENSNQYDSENLDNEPGSQSKDITGKDIEKHLIEHDPSGVFETDIDNQNSSEAESSSFETIEPEKDNPVKKEFEIGQPGNQELRKDERARDKSGNIAPGHDKPSRRKF